MVQPARSSSPVRHIERSVLRSFYHDPQYSDVTIYLLQRPKITRTQIHTRLRIQNVSHPLQHANKYWIRIPIDGIWLRSHPLDGKVDLWVWLGPWSRPQPIPTRRFLSRCMAFGVTLSTTPSCQETGQNNRTYVITNMGKRSREIFLPLRSHHRQSFCGQWCSDEENGEVLLALQERLCSPKMSLVVAAIWKI